jgi:hypothetical protein
MVFSEVEGTNAARAFVVCKLYHDAVPRRRTRGWRKVQEKRTAISKKLDIQNPEMKTTRVCLPPSAEIDDAQGITRPVPILETDLCAVRGNSARPRLAKLMREAQTQAESR